MKTLLSNSFSYSEFHFENMNCLIEKDIKFFEIIFFDHSIDTGENDNFCFYIYPNRTSSEIKQKFKKIEVLHKFMKSLTKKLVKDFAKLSIWNWVLEDTDVVHLLRNKIWKEITFVNCLIQNTKKVF